MSEKVYIYGLYDPNTKELRYVGKTNNLNKRLWHHIRDAQLGQRTYKATWIRKLLRDGERPIISVIQETTDDKWQEDEKKYIAQAKRDGVNLTNLTAGGDGLVGYKCSDETRQKISKYHLDNGTIPPNWKGRKQSPEHIAKRVEARKANGTYNHSQETKDLISHKNTGKNLGNTHTLGMKHTDEWKEEMSRRNSGEDNPFYGRQHSDEAKRKISEAKKGIKTSEEVRAKLSVAQRERAKRNHAAHVARIAIPHSELITMSDDPQINEIYRLYVGGMTKMEIAAHLGYKGKWGRFHRKMSKAIKAIPVTKDKLKIGDTITRRMEGVKRTGSRYWDCPGIVTTITDETITGTFIIDQPRLMTFDIHTGININGLDYGRLLEIGIKKARGDE